jgi:hypothetical protein
MSPVASRRPRRGIVLALVSLAAIVGFFAVFAVWVSRQLLETDTWTDTSSQLLENNDIQVAVAGFITEALYNNVDVQGELEKALPPKAAPLAGPAAGAVRELANRLALEALQHPKVQELWANANRTAQEALLTIVKGGTPAVSTAGGEVTLNLKTIVDQVGSELGIDVSSKVPPEAESIVILKSDQLSTAQSIANALRPLALGLSLGAIAIFALAIYLARGWRREALRACGFAFVAVGIAALAARALAGRYVVDALASTDAVKPAAQATWDIGTSLLKAGAAAVLLYGIVIVVGAWLAGPGRVASSLRRELTPALRDPKVAYPALGLLLLIVFWWNPTPGTSRVLPSVALILLSVAGVEALRRVAVRDFPEETMATASERWSGRFDAALAGRRRTEPKPAAPMPAEERLAALERLAGLRDSGALTEAEFERQKARILGEG